jgi:hypothetical protein
LVEYKHNFDLIEKLIGLAMDRLTVTISPQRKASGGIKNALTKFATNSPQRRDMQNRERRNSAGYIGEGFCGDKKRFCCTTENKFQLSH